jgi:hypothetical protein
MLTRIFRLVSSSTKSELVTGVPWRDNAQSVDLSLSRIQCQDCPELISYSISIFYHFIRLTAKSYRSRLVSAPLGKCGGIGARSSIIHVMGTQVFLGSGFANLNYDV